MVPTIEEEEIQQQQQQLHQVEGGGTLKATTLKQPSIIINTNRSTQLPASNQKESLDSNSAGGGGGPQNYLSSLITKSSILLHTLKQQYSTGSGSGSGNSSSSSSLSLSRSGSYKKNSMQQSQQAASASGSSSSGQSTNVQQSASETQAGKMQNNQQQQAIRSASEGEQCDINEQVRSRLQQQQQQVVKPPLPPPPPCREALRAAASMSLVTGSTTTNPFRSQQSTTTTTTTTGAHISTSSFCPTPQQQQQSATVNAQTGSSLANARRHAIQEQSLERDAALSLKARDLKHKRTSSIKSALRHANLGSLRGHSQHSGGSDSSGSGGGGGKRGWLDNSDSKSSSASGKVKSMPYELFEPPVTQRTFQRSKRRGAMSDPKRQMSADTIGLRQLTDEYLQNAGVKPISSSGQCSLVALTAPSSVTAGGCTASISGSSNSGSGVLCSGVVSNSVVQNSGGVSGGGPLMSNTSGGGGGGGGGSGSSGSGGVGGISAGQSQFAAIETQLYQASKRTLISSSNQRLGGGGVSSSSNQEMDNRGSEDSLSQVAIYPGNLPWQCDVSVQCELIQAPQALGSPQDLPYETTGDILNTIAGPFRAGSSNITSSLDGQQTGTGSGSTSNQISATLKRGLTAISQHHLTPSSVVAPTTATAALNVVGLHLKKSLSNTLDISRATHHLHSQDSLPAYSNLLNEPESPDRDSLQEQQIQSSSATPTNGPTAAATAINQDLELNSSSGGGGLIGQLASKLARQSSSKKKTFSVSRKGLQRALSFDCRGYKRLEGQQQQNQQQDNNNKNNHNKQHLSASNHQVTHNRSALNLEVSPRPYLPQSASQVDFQLPLLPYHKMQEAIVSQRLIDPPPRPNNSAQSQPEVSIGSGSGNNNNNNNMNEGGRPDANELICGGQQLTADALIIAPQDSKQQQQTKEQGDRGRQQEQQEVSSGCLKRESSSSSSSNVTTTMQLSGQRIAPKLVLDIPTIATPTNHQETGIQQHKQQQHQQINYPPDDEEGEEVCGVDQDEDSKATVIVCLPSPNISIDPGFNCLPNSTSFCIDPDNKQLTVGGNCSYGLGSNQLTANDVFSSSKSLIKRPSTMLVSDTMNQVAQALNNTGSQAAAAAKQAEQSVVLRNRRQAIVPPKLATDGSTSDGEQQQQDSGTVEGKLVDVDDDDDNDYQQQQQGINERAGGQLQHKQDNGALNADADATVRALRRKRSGGGAAGQESRPHQAMNSGRRLSGSQAALPTFCIEQEPENSMADGHASSLARQTPEDWRRPDSQATNADSIVSSGSSTNLSMANKRGDFTVTSPGGLTVSFGSSRGRRRSSIAVIPQMQICPGDLLVYSKQLIDRMNQSDETEPPQFLTIDDKKAKNIWSSFKLFDNRTMKARNELLCSLEDVLASLQPSTFVDEQLSHYKGMLWNEFLYETESRRSASSEILSLAVGNDDENNNNNNNNQENDQKLHVRISEPKTFAKHADDKIGKILSSTQTGSHQQELASLVATTSSCSVQQQQQQTRETLKASMSSGPIQQVSTAGSAATASGGHRSREPGTRTLSSRFREKPKLKRGQTVDSVFRIPLIPSSPLKHAQQHQQTPTAHLEEHSMLNEDDERSSTSGGGSGIVPGDDDDDPHAHLASKSSSSVQRKSRSSSTRSRAGSSGGGATRRLLSAGGQQEVKTTLEQESVRANINDQDSSFETDDAMDLIVGLNYNQHHNSQSNSGRTPHQIVRQSSLSTLSSTITRTEQKRQRALWDLFQSECTFFFDHLLTLKNVYMEPLKKIQVEGFAMFADPDVLFGNLDELCCGVYDFCKEFLYIIMRTLKTRPEELNATDVLIKLYKKNPKIDHLRGVYHRYTLNYINALTYLESLRRQVEFVEFEKWSSRDVRCKKLQLTDLLVAPVQHIMRVPIILKDIESHTENPRDRDEIRAILAVEEASLRELDDKMRWLKNFERLLEIQKNISWPSVLEQDSKLFIPEFLKEVLSKQPCEKLIVSPRRQIVHEGTLSNLDLGKACDMHVILFDDMLLLTRRKKGLTKKASTVCKTNSGSSSIREDGSFKYIVYKQPLSLDRFYVHDVQQVDAHSIGLKHLFLLIVMNRFQQITNVHSFSAPNDDIKQTWLFKIKKTSERWKKNFSTSSGEQTELQQQQQQQQSNVQMQQQQQQQATTNQPANNYQSEQTNQQTMEANQQQYQPLVPKVVNLSTAMRQVNIGVNHQEQATNRRSTAYQSVEPIQTMSPSRVVIQQAQSQILASPYSTPAKTIDTRSNNYHQTNTDRRHHYHQQQSIELVITSASGGNNSHSSSTNVSSLAPAH